MKDPEEPPFVIGELNADTPHLLADLIELIVLMGFDGHTQYSPAIIESILVAECSTLTGSRPKDVVAEAWRQFSYRAGRFDGAYPIAIGTGTIKPARRCIENRVYTFLLACSRMRSFRRKLRQKWAAGFAALSIEAMKSLVPEWAESRIFDANSEDRRKHYGTDLRDALQVLGRDTGARSVDEGEIARLSASGDYKIDLVSTCSFDDGAHTHHVLLGQCAARGESWPEKRLEAHRDSLSGVFTFSHAPANFLFTPVSFRQTNGAWVDNTSTSGCIVIDRWRLVKLLRQSKAMRRVSTASWFSEFESAFAEIADSLRPETA